MARPLIPFVQNGYYASRNWIPLVKGNGFTTSGGGEQEEVWETASGSIVTFDAIASPLRQLSVAVEPVQNLNGYDNPWPAGGGKNKFNPSDVREGKFISSDYKVGQEISLNNSSASNVIAKCCKVQAGDTYYFSFQKGAAPSSSNGRYGCVCDDNDIVLESGILTWSDNKAYIIIQPNQSGWLWVTVDNKSSNFQIETGSATPYAPYSNICPISGWDGVTVELTGKNLLNDANEGSYTNEIELPNGTYYAQAFLLENPSKHTTNAQVYVNGSWVGAAPPYTGDGVSITGTFFGWLWSDATQTITVTGGPIKIRYARNNNAMQTRRLSLSTAELSEFVEYNPLSRSISISFGSTVYGGTLDVVNGKMTVDRAMVDLGTLAWNLSNGNFYAYMPTNAKAPVANGQDALCENYPVYVGNYNTFITLDKLMQVCNSSFSARNKFVLVRDSAFSDAAAFKTAMDGVQLVYELATPITIPLTPEQISTLQGTNNVWSDAGDVTVEYRAQ